jgi:hypothetical protein
MPYRKFFLLRHSFIPQQAEFHHLCIVQDKSFQPALMEQVTCHIYTWHIQDFNFTCNINQGLTYLHALSLDSYHHHHTIVKPAASHHHHHHHSQHLLKYAARILEVQEQHQSKFVFDLSELGRQTDVYYDISILPI